ncbi:hypothetical protein N9B39_01430, partial [bacterium]|nr:hypothetical protein [bacterium]
VCGGWSESRAEKVRENCSSRLQSDKEEEIQRRKTETFTGSILSSETCFFGSCARLCYAKTMYLGASDQ